MDDSARRRVPARMLQAIGRALYGDRWQTGLARLLKEPSPRRVQRWAAAGQEDRLYPVSEEDLALMLGLLERKVRDVQDAYDAAKAFYDGER